MPITTRFDPEEGDGVLAASSHWLGGDWGYNPIPAHRVSEAGSYCTVLDGSGMPTAILCRGIDAGNTGYKSTGWPPVLVTDAVGQKVAVSTDNEYVRYASATYGAWSSADYMWQYDEPGGEAEIVLGEDQVQSDRNWLFGQAREYLGMQDLAAGPFYTSARPDVEHAGKTVILSLHCGGAGVPDSVHVVARCRSRLSVGVSRAWASFMLSEFEASFPRYCVRIVSGWQFAYAASRYHTYVTNMNIDLDFAAECGLQIVDAGGAVTYGDLLSADAIGRVRIIDLLPSQSRRGPFDVSIDGDQLRSMLSDDNELRLGYVLDHDLAGAFSSPWFYSDEYLLQEPLRTVYGGKFYNMPIISFPINYGGAYGPLLVGIFE